jgi:hypothetical protein
MSGKWHGGKGSSPRPLSISQQDYEKRWDYIFSRDLKEVKEEKTNEDGEVLMGKPIIGLDKDVVND